MSSAPIPQDIISLIIEQHLLNDIPTLRACSLVSRSFVASSQKGLFHTIHLDHDLRAQQHCQRLHNVFLGNPELLTHVRELYVMDYCSVAAPTIPRLRLPTRLIHWASKEESLPALLNMLPLLRLFSFGHTHTNEWKSISVELKSALFGILKLPSLKICKLNDIHNLPRDFFSSFEHLKKLSLVQVSIAQDPPGASAPPVGSKRVQLESLALINSRDYSLPDAIRASVDMSQLREVSVCSELPNVVWEVTKDSIGSLEILTWDYYARHVGFSAVKMHLSAFTKLRVLRVGAEPCHEPQYNMLMWLVSSLRDIASSVGDGVVNLEEIVVHLDCGPFRADEAASMLLQTRISAWEDLDTLLASSPKFPRLRKLKIYVCNLTRSIAVWDAFGVKDVEQLFRIWMSHVFKKGFLEVKPTTLYLEHILAIEDEA